MSHMVSEFIYKFLESNMSFTMKTNSKGPNSSQQLRYCHTQTFKL